MKGPWEFCECGHSMVLHDVEDMDGSDPRCCVDGCDQDGCGTAPSDVLERAEPFLEVCGSCDAGLLVPCSCPSGDYRTVMADLVHEVKQLRDAGAAAGVVCRCSWLGVGTPPHDPFSFCLKPSGGDR